MAHHNMITVGSYEDNVLAGTGQNTIRKAVPKYSVLKPGDVVVMKYATEFDADNNPIKVEAQDNLVIKSVSYCSLETAFDVHGLCNSLSTLSFDDWKEFFTKCYGHAEADMQVIVIYFE